MQAVTNKPTVPDMAPEDQVADSNDDKPGLSRAVRALFLVGELAFVGWALAIGAYFYHEMGFGQLLGQLLGGLP
jgi:hypothetical protein